MCRGRAQDRHRIRLGVKAVLAPLPGGAGAGRAKGLTRDDELLGLALTATNNPQRNRRPGPPTQPADDLVDRQSLYRRIIDVRDDI